VGGVLATGVASGLYIGARLGPGPRDGLMTGVAIRWPGRWFAQIRVVRTAIEVLVRVWRRDIDNGIAVGRKTIELHPYLQVARCSYADALLLAGRGDDALAQYQRASAMSPDLPWVRALEGACLARLGRLGEATEILDELEESRDRAYVDACHMAILLLAMDARDAAREELARAREENSAWLYALDVDPRLEGL